MSWRRAKHGDDRRLNLGHGLVLRVWYEGIERLPPGAAKYNVGVFGQRLISRSATAQDGKRRAEHAARRWLQEALLKL